MTLTPGDDLDETARQRTRDQFALIRQAFGTTVITDSDDPADFSFMCHSDRVLVEDDAAADQLEGYFTRRVVDPEDDVFTDAGARDPTQREGEPYRRYLMPRRRDSAPGDKGLLLTLDELDANPATSDLARPDHLVHICPK